MAVLSRESFGMEEAMEIEIELCEVSRVSLGGGKGVLEWKNLSDAYCFENKLLQKHKGFFGDIHPMPRTPVTIL